jgi:hypothetical protein
VAGEPLSIGWRDPGIMTSSSRDSEHDAFSERHRGGAFFQQLGADLYLNPYLGYALAPGHRSAGLNTDDEGFRVSDSPFGAVDSASWLAGGGGALLLGSSVAFGLGASSDRGTLASQLAFLTRSRWLNLGVLAANSLQELVAAVPFLHAASTVVVFSGMGNYLLMMRERTPGSVFGPVFYAGTFAKLARTPLFDLAALAAGQVPAAAPGSSPEAPPAADLSDAAARMRTAARLQLRDLSVLARAARAETRILFCLQPMEPPGRETGPEQQDYETALGVSIRVLAEHLGAYTGLLAHGCAELGVTFLPLTASDFAGHAFVSNGVLSDEGNRQAAAIIHRILAGA